VPSAVMVSGNYRESTFGTKFLSSNPALDANFQLFCWLFQSYVPLIETFLKSSDDTSEDETEVLFSHAWDSMLKLSFISHLHKDDADVAGNNDIADYSDFLSWIGKLFAWTSEEIISFIPKESRLANYIVVSLIQVIISLKLRFN